MGYFLLKNVHFLGQRKLRSTVHGPHRKEKRQNVFLKIASKVSYDRPLVKYARLFLKYVGRILRNGEEGKV